MKFDFKFSYFEFETDNKNSNFFTKFKCPKYFIEQNNFFKLFKIIFCNYFVSPSIDAAFRNHLWC